MPPAAMMAREDAFWTVVSGACSLRSTSSSLPSRTSTSPCSNGAVSGKPSSMGAVGVCAPNSMVHARFGAEPEYAGGGRGAAAPAGAPSSGADAGVEWRYTLSQFSILPLLGFMAALSGSGA